MLLLHHLDSSSFRKLHASLTHMPLAVAIIKRKDGSLLYGNKSCRELLGIRKLDGRYLYPDEINPQMMFDFFCGHFLFVMVFAMWAKSCTLCRGEY